MAAALGIGAHVAQERQLEAAAALGVDCVQIFLGKPQGWERPPERDDAPELRDSAVGLYVHAPYLINVCSPKPNVRHGSRKILQQHCDAAATVGAAALIVHPGHAEDGTAEGVRRWAKTLEALTSEVPVYLENTAGGENAVARRADALARLWEAVSAAETEVEVGFCFDTCHAHAAGEELSDVVERMGAITGRVDLCHANDSRDAAGTGADRHANLGCGEMDPDDIRRMIRACGAPVIVETPAAGHPADLEFVRRALSAQ
ncbi:MAG: deoxyribonuclease IV [bacterium]